MVGGNPVEATSSGVDHKPLCSARDCRKLRCPASTPDNNQQEGTRTMYRKFLLAIAACLPIALSGCGGGGGTPAASTASPSGTQTPAAALTAAENAVAAANSAKTAAAVEAARRALDAAVETAAAAVETVEADSATLRTVEADVQTYQTQQTAILDGLQPITPASLATVKPAATLQLRITWRSGRLTPPPSIIFCTSRRRTGTTPQSLRRKRPWPARERKEPPSESTTPAAL